MVNGTKTLVLSCLLFTVYCLLFAASSPAYAEVEINPTTFPFAGNFASLGDIVNILLPNLFIFAGIGVLIIGVLAGFKIIQGAGSGDAKSAEQGKKTLTYAIVGIVIIFTSLFVLQLIKFLTGIDVLNPNLGPSPTPIP